MTKLWIEHLDKLGKEFQLREDELELLHEIDQQLLKPEPPDSSFFDHVLSRVERIFGSYRTRILLKRGSQLIHEYSTIASEVGTEILAANSVTARCITNDETINEGDLNPELSSEVGGPPVRHSVLASPLHFLGHPIGVLCTESESRNAYTESHGEALVKIAAQVSLAVARVRSVSEDFVKALDALTYNAEDSNTVIRTALGRVVEELRRLALPFSGVQILFIEGNQLEIVHSTNDSDVGIRVPIDGSISGRAVRERTTQVVGNVDEDPDYVRLLGKEIQSEIAVPLFLSGTVPIGVLNVESTQPDIFGGFTEVLVSNFADRIRLLLAMTKLRANVTDALEVRATNELMAAVGDQATHMVHRLNNTVGAMRFRILDLQDSWQGGQLDASYLGESLDMLLTLANQTLEMPRRVSQLLGTGELNATINQCIRDAVAGVRIPDDVALDLRLSDDVTLRAPSNFDIVVQNLAQNAVDAMREGGTLVIRTAAERHPMLGTTSVQVAFADTGEGIPPEVQPRIFDLAFTTKAKTRQGTGTGIGLWWVRNFVRRAGGDINFTTESGKGTEFVIRLPAMAGEPNGQPDTDRR